jgi:hypothetical protein
MIKKDPIFWCASGIFVLALLLFAVTNQQLWLFLMIISYMLRPTLASLGVAKHHVDERQMSIYYRSGNIGFAVMIICCVIFAIKLSAENNHDFEMFIAAIVIGLAAKALFNIILIKNFRETASKIIIGVGLLVALFASFDAGSFTGIIISILPGLVIAGIGLLARKYPRVIGIVIIILAIASMIFLLTFKKGWGQLVAAVVVGIPLFLAGIGLFRAGKADEMVDSELQNSN